MAIDKIYVDTIRPCLRNKNWKYDESCHLFVHPDTPLIELHCFAEKLGLVKAYFQTHSFLPHYDLAPGMQKKAIKLGAKLIDNYDELRVIFRAWRRHAKSTD